MSKTKLDNRHMSILSYIYDHPYISYSELAASFPAFFDLESLVNLLEQFHVISFREASSADTDKDGYETLYLENYSHLATTTSGNSIIEEERRHLDELNKQLQPLRDLVDKTAAMVEAASRQADASLIQAQLAVEQAAKADKASKSARIRANLSIIISAIALIATILATADSIFNNILMALSHLF